MYVTTERHCSRPTAVDTDRVFQRPVHAGRRDDRQLIASPLATHWRTLAPSALYSPPVPFYHSTALSENSHTLNTNTILEHYTGNKGWSVGRVYLPPSLREAKSNFIAYRIRAEEQTHHKHIIIMYARAHPSFEGLALQ